MPSATASPRAWGATSCNGAPSATEFGGHQKCHNAVRALGVHRQQHLRCGRGVKPGQLSGQDRVVNGESRAGRASSTLLSSGAAPPPTSLLPAGCVLLPMPIPAMGLLGRRHHDGNATSGTIAADRSRPDQLLDRGPDDPAGRYKLARVPGRQRDLKRPPDRLGVQQRRPIRGGRRADGHLDFGTQMGSFSVKNYRSTQLHRDRHADVTRAANPINSGSPPCPVAEGSTAASTARWRPKPAAISISGRRPARLI